MLKSNVYYNKIYTDTITMYRELKTISGTASCSTTYGNPAEMSMFPLIIEFIADIESTLKRMRGLPVYKIGIEFELLQLYPFNSYSRRSPRRTIIDYITPIENINGEKIGDNDNKL